ncbi:hypothetical protein QE152_g605 [Popillia japonica]|uniref:Uncharacterized protein n=1 Tax=Popillia japonica TaxID=7064 RepID=A0AAW1NJA0_POPJA
METPILSSSPSQKTPSTSAPEHAVIEDEDDIIFVSANFPTLSGGVSGRDGDDDNKRYSEGQNLYEIRKFIREIYDTERIDVQNCRSKKTTLVYVSKEDVNLLTNIKENDLAFNYQIFKWATRANYYTVVDPFVVRNHSCYRFLEMYHTSFKLIEAEIRHGGFRKFLKKTQCSDRFLEMYHTSFKLIEAEIRHGGFRKFLKKTQCSDNWTKLVCKWWNRFYRSDEGGDLFRQDDDPMKKRVALYLYGPTNVGKK